MTATQQGERPTHATGQNVRAEMARKHISQTYLATQLGLSQTSVSARLRGQTPWTIDELVDAARVLDVPLGNLLPPVH